MGMHTANTATTRSGLAGAVATAAVSLLMLAPTAWATFGDEYGAAPINGHPDAIQDAPAIPGDHAVWAGACDRSAAPGFGEDLSAIGNGTGFGARPDTVLASRSDGVLPRLPAPPQVQVPVPAPASPDHCLDWGAQTIYGMRMFQGTIWQTFPYDTGAPHFSGGTIGQELAPNCTFAATPPLPAECDRAPQWRLPALTTAGGHPDGTSMLAWNRNDEGVGALPGSVDGSPDNVYVELPPGFVGNPQAVPQCSNVQFRERPLLCPPESQVGVIRLNLEGVCTGTPCNMLGTYDTTYPVYNLEPRQGKVAELGFAYAGDFAAVRLVAKARTNGDFGVTAFAGQIPAALVAISQQVTLWGVPWAAENDQWRPRLGHRDNTVTELLHCRVQPGTGANIPEYIPPGGLPGEECQAHYDPSWGEIKPFLTNETDCNPAPTVRLSTDSFQKQGAFTAEGDPDLPPTPELLTGAAADLSGWKTYQSPSPAVTRCADLDFRPELELTPSSAAADGPSGLHAELTVPQNDDLPFDPPAVGAPAAEVDDYVADAGAHWRSDAGRASAHLKDTVVTLPAGVSLNPSAATGLEGCSDAGIGLRPGTDAYSGRPLFNNGDPFDKDGGADGAECPDGSKIGTATVNTPLLEKPLEGEVVLGEPKSTDPRSGEMFRLFIVVRLPERGLIAKIYGSTTADGVIGDGGSGQLVTTFQSNPEVPFTDLSVDIKGGDKGVLALPPVCGNAAYDTSLTPWSAMGAPVEVPAVTKTATFPVLSNCDHGHNPGIVAGMSGREARGGGVFSLRLSRPEGDRTVRGLSVGMPDGLLASVRGVPLCSNAAGNAGSCGEGSRIGSVDGAAGSGTPFVLEKKGSVYLTEGYKGAPYGLSIVVPVEAGPFRGPLALSPIVVRAAIEVDRRTAKVTAVSDPLPQVWHGVPLRVREIVASIDRPNFMLNPSDCSPKQVVAHTSSWPAGIVASPSSRFEVTNCARLGFKPKLAIRLTGRRQATTGKHPGVRAQVTQTSSEAGIERAEVRLPKSLALDPDNAQALCEFADGTKPDLERHCPKGSIVGRARAVSPLLNRPLVGNVYFVKNVRRDPETGNEIRTLPMIVAALRGEIAINLFGESDVKNQKLVSTFASVPDAPVSRFNLSIKGGKNGILAVTRTRKSRINLCTKPKRHIAISRMDGHNGRDFDKRITLKTPCAKKKKANKGKRRQRARQPDGRRS